MTTVSGAVDKISKLEEILLSYKSAIVALSGGVDSSFLLAMAHKVLGEDVVAVTAVSDTYPESELEEAKKVAEKIGVKHTLVKTNELNDPYFVKNNPERCYYCKKELLLKFKKIAIHLGINHILCGDNADDKKDHRPGSTAIKELGAKTPLADAGLTKSEIRQMAREMGLPVWNKPAFACLASRIPFGEKITSEKLEQIEKAEEVLKSYNLRQFRVRHHGEIARIEIYPDEFEKIMKDEVRLTIVEKLKSYGFKYITIDLEGYISFARRLSIIK
jgi:uncharacterized protein